jgi:ParB/RepB/Spo0J family partition protein
MDETRISDLPVIEIKAGDNDRTIFDPERLRELAESIQTNGLAQPITVRPLTNPNGKKYEIIAGERRFRAISTILGWGTAPCLIRVLTDEEASAIMLAENSHRSDLNPMDEARAYDKRIKQFVLTLADLVRMANKSDKHITARLRLLELVPEAQHLIEVGQLKIQWAEKLFGLDNNRQRIALKHLASTPKILFWEFSQFCGELLGQQKQESLFDLDSIFQVQQEFRDEVTKARSRAHIFIKPNLPKMKRVKRSIGTSLEQYIIDLLETQNPADDITNAIPVVAFLYNEIVNLGLAIAPPAGDSPLEQYINNKKSQIQSEKEISNGQL